VTGAKVKAGSLDASDFRAGSLPAGAQGERGPAGPQGDPGTASAYAARTSTDALTSGIWTTVLSLSQTGTASGAITTTRRSRLAITAAVTVFGSSTSGTPGLVACRPMVTRSGQAVALNGADINAWAALPVSTAGNAFQTIAVVNSAVVEAGTYDVLVECEPFVGTSAVAIDRFLRVEAAAA
jgi:hypothetical protein